MEKIPLAQETSPKSLDKSPEAIFKSYQEDFSLSTEDLQKPLLDVGAGRGAFIQYVRESLDNKNAYGVELHEDNVRSHAEGIVIADGSKLPFSDETFSIVLAHNYIPIFYAKKDESATLLTAEEMLRVLRPEGRLLFNTSSVEKELKNMKLDNSEWSKRRYENSVKFFNQLEELKNGGISVTIKKTPADRTIVSIEK